jgi:hypothetical protein
MTIGKLGLSDSEENDIVAFLQTLTDGFLPSTPATLTTPAKAALPPAHD